ncbi:MAG TPA: DUF3488 and transglutaminase-like domain-containing protein, partial [Thermoanaerobaculia bacterium]|nr:DUF3488 and transglutaminase-like domain-containing protein [Thermoanaerobaculia bacterium]
MLAKAAKTAKTRPDPALLPFRRERILAVGTLLALGPVPLAFGDSLQPSVLLVYLATLGVLLGFVRAGKVPCLADRWLNLAGLAYFALFWFGFRFGGRSLLKTALHILLFTAVLKLASIKRERDFSVALTLAVFLLVASMATATHATILVFLAAYAAVAWPLLSRWALWRDLAAAPDEWRCDERAREIPSRRAVAASLAASFVLAVPMFILLPRLKSSYIQGLPGGDTSDTGFSDTVDTNLYGRLRQSDKVFLRVAVEEGPVGDDPPFLKIRLVAHTRFVGGVWKKPDGRGRVIAMREGSRLPLRPPGSEASEPLHRLSFEIAPLGVRFLPYPVTAISGAASPELIRRYGVVPLVRDGDGNFHLTFEPPKLFRVEVLSGPKPAVDLVPPADLDPSREAMGSETLSAFGRDVAGGIDPAASPYLFASRIADHLATRFFYSVDSARWGPTPVEEFLTQRKSGHCETFATAMALVLREHGIPSRLVTGFAGGERGLFGSYYLVRGLDAHAWVEAWCGPGYGWIAFDPTPPAGRPGVTKVSVLRSTGQLFENLEFLYGRYVLGFAQADQASLAETVREGVEVVSQTAKGVVRALRAFVQGGSGYRFALLVLGAAAVVAAILLLRRLSWAGAGFGTRGLPPASAAYRTLQRVLRRQGADLTPASAPSETLASADRLGAGRISQEIVGA